MGQSELITQTGSLVELEDNAFSAPKIRQDDLAEGLIIEMFGHVPGNKRDGFDARDRFGNPVEYKTSTKSNMATSTARGFWFGHIEKYRQCIFLYSFGNLTRKGLDLKRVFLVTPMGMKPWLDMKFAECAQLASENGRIISDLVATGNYPYEFLVGKANGRSMLGKPSVAQRLKKGSTGDDPTIPFSYVKRHGCEIDIRGDHASIRAQYDDLAEGYARSLREITVHPSTVSEPETGFITLGGSVLA